jgi:hypothetical protein
MRGQVELGEKEFSLLEGFGVVLVVAPFEGGNRAQGGQRGQRGVFLWGERAAVAAVEGVLQVGVAGPGVRVEALEVLDGPAPVGPFEVEDYKAVSVPEPVAFLVVTMGRNSRQADGRHLLYEAADGTFEVNAQQSAGTAQDCFGFGAHGVGEVRKGAGRCGVVEAAKKLPGLVVNGDAFGVGKWCVVNEVTGGSCQQDRALCGVGGDEAGGAAGAEGGGPLLVGGGFGVVEDVVRVVLEVVGAAVGGVDLPDAGEGG